MIRIGIVGVGFMGMIHYLATLEQFGASHGIGRQQRRLPGDVADQGWTLAFEESEPAQFGIDAAALAAGRLCGR
jgi:hypothetical protein